VRRGDAAPGGENAAGCFFADQVRGCPGIDWPLTSSRSTTSILRIGKVVVLKSCAAQMGRFLVLRNHSPIFGLLISPVTIKRISFIMVSTSYTVHYDPVGLLLMINSAGIHRER